MKSSVTVVILAALTQVIGAVPVLFWATELEPHNAVGQSPNVHHVQRRANGMELEFKYPIIQVPYFSTGLYGLTGWRGKYVAFDTAGETTISLDDWTPPAWWRNGR